MLLFRSHDFYCLKLIFGLAIFVASNVSTCILWQHWYKTKICMRTKKNKENMLPDKVPKLYFFVIYFNRKICHSLLSTKNLFLKNLQKIEPVQQYFKNGWTGSTLRIFLQFQSTQNWKKWNSISYLNTIWTR